MKFKLHNKIVISSKENKYVFFNTMLKSVCDKYKNLDKFNNCIAIGTGKGLHNETDYKLFNFVKSYNLNEEYLQDDISGANDIFIKKTAIIDDSSLDGVYLTEVGITDSLENNPTIYNYFSLISNDNPNGILKTAGEPLTISIYIYLVISSSGDGLLTAGKNKMIDFLLGNGINDKIYACRGKNLSTNDKFIYREAPRETEKFECNMNFLFSDDSISLSFEANLGVGEVYEIVFLIGDCPFARINELNFKLPTSHIINATPDFSYTINLGENIKSIENATAFEEPISDLKTVKYATDFGDKITLPFYNLFDNNTPRFLSKDGKMIFFISGNKIYGYINKDYEIVQINTNGEYIENIVDIISFDKFVFIISKSKPYINSYIVENNEFIECSVDLDSFEKNELFKDMYKVEITRGNNNQFMIGFIANDNHYGYVLYYRFDRVNRLFYLNNYLTSEYYLTDIIGVYKNNFIDAFMVFLKGETTVYESRIVYIYQDNTIKEIYATDASNILSANDEIYIKNRMLITEKSYKPRIEMYKFPDFDKIELSISDNEDNDYFSSNMLYLIQKFNKEYRIYSLANIHNPIEFKNGFPSEIPQNKILDFEFLNDTLLIFMDNKIEPVVAYNLFDNLLLVENVSSSLDYEFSVLKYNLVGQNNEEVITTFVVNINV